MDLKRTTARGLDGGLFSGVTIIRVQLHAGPSECAWNLTSVVRLRYQRDIDHSELSEYHMSSLGKSGKHTFPRPSDPMPSYNAVGHLQLSGEPCTSLGTWSSVYLDTRVCWTHIEAILLNRNRMPGR